MFLFIELTLQMQSVVNNQHYMVRGPLHSLCPASIYFASLVTKLRSCGQLQQPSSATDIQSGLIIMAAALISWHGFTWMLCSSATNTLAGVLGSTRWLKEQLYT